MAEVAGCPGHCCPNIRRFIKIFCQTSSYILTNVALNFRINISFSKSFIIYETSVVLLPAVVCAILAAYTHHPVQNKLLKIWWITVNNFRSVHLRCELANCSNLIYEGHLWGNDGSWVIFDQAALIRVFVLADLWRISLIQRSYNSQRHLQRHNTLNGSDILLSHFNW